MNKQSSGVRSLPIEAGNNTEDTKFNELLDEKYFTAWEQYIGVPISWNPVTGDRWIANLDFDQTLKQWIEENKEYLLQVYKYHMVGVN